MTLQYILGNIRLFTPVLRTYYRKIVDYVWYLIIKLEILLKKGLNHEINRDNSGK